LFTQIKEAVESKEYAKASDLQVIIEKKIAELRQSYSTYKKNLLDL
jgi:hypothetical protein